jgi:hypothetical protein
LPTISPRDAPTSTCLTAIRPDADDGAILRRAAAVRANFFVPGLDPEAEANALSEFLVALKPFPHWAMMRAFDTWTRTMTRRPSPGEIAILADREVKPWRDEVQRRQREAREQAEAEAERNRKRMDPALVDRLCREMGYSPERAQRLMRAPLVRSEDELRQRESSPDRWAHVSPENDPAAAAVLQASRDQNTLIQQARASAERQATKEA